MGNIVDNWVICDKIIEKNIILTKTVSKEAISKNFDQKKVICKKKKFYILLAHLLIKTVLLLAVHFFSIKYQAN